MNRKLIRRLDLFVGLTLLGSALLGVALTFGVSRIQYGLYEVEYNKEIEELKKQLPALPKQVYIDNQFVTYDNSHEFISSHKSSYSNIKSLRASEATFTTAHLNDNNAKYEVFDNTNNYGQSLGGFDSAGGGSVTFNINLDHYADADIDLMLASANWSSEISGNTSTINISQYIDIKLDGLLVDASLIDLPCNDKNNWFEFNHVILKDCHLKAGTNTLTLSTREDASKVIMPNINGIHVFSSEEYSKELKVNGDTMMLIKHNNVDYLEFSGVCHGYEASQLSMDLCFNAQYENQIPSGALSVVVRDGSFLMKIRLDRLPKGTLYSHFYLDGELYNSGRETGDIMTVSFSNVYTDWNNPVTIQTLDNYSLICQLCIMTIKID